MSAVAAIEIALDLETLHASDLSRAAFSGAHEPRICLVAAFALTPHLKRIVAAINRVIPARAPQGLRMARPPTRLPGISTQLSLEPMLVLLRLQSKLIRAIEPGLMHDQDLLPYGSVQGLGEAAERYIRDFIPCGRLPTFEPQTAGIGTEVVELRAIGMTMYRLGDRGAPESMLAHWSYDLDSRGSLHLESGP